MRLSNADFDLIMRDYDSRQYRSNSLFLEKKKTLYKAIPELQLLDETLLKESASLAKKAAFLSDEEFSASLNRLTEQKKEGEKTRLRLMREGGFAPDYLTDIYECSLCSDTGFVFGEKCRCFHETATKLLKSREMLSRLPENAKFVHFKADYYEDNDYYEETGKNSRENALLALKKAKDYVEHFSSSSSNLIIYGNTGTGKSFLAGCIANALTEKSYSVAFVTAFQFYELLEKYSFQREEKSFSLAEDGVHYMMEADLLVLDDIGTEQDNRFTRTKLYEFINEKLLKEKPVILTTNLEPQGINEVYGERLLSRLIGNYDFIKLTGKDIRLKKKAESLD